MTKGPAGMTEAPTAPSPLAGECRGEGVSGHDKKGQSRPSVIPDVSNPPSVIPDIFNRESMAFPMQAHSNKVTEKKDTGFPLTTGGHDRGRPAGMTKEDQQA